MSEFQWSDYWREGAITSFAADFDGNYEGLLKQVWDEFLVGCKSGDKLLDIATGNAAIPLLAKEFATAHQVFLDITGTDLADINEALLEQRFPDLAQSDAHKLTLLSRVDSCDLPFSDGEFQWLTSSFGFEYAETEACVKECARVLCKGAQAQFLIHHSQSVILLRNNDILACLKALLANDGAIENLVQLNEEIGDVSSKAQLQRLKTSVNAERLRALINEEMSRLMDKHTLGFTDTGLARLMNDFFRELLVGPASRRRERLSAYEEVSQSLILRLENLSDASCGEGKMAEIEHLFRAAGIDETHAERLEDSEGQLMAWQVRLRK